MELTIHIIALLAGMFGLGAGGIFGAILAFTLTELILKILYVSIANRKNDKKNDKKNKSKADLLNEYKINFYIGISITAVFLFLLIILISNPKTKDIEDVIIILSVIFGLPGIACIVIGSRYFKLKRENTPIGANNCNKHHKKFVTTLAVQMIQDGEKINKEEIAQRGNIREEDVAAYLAMGCKE